MATTAVAINKETCDRSLRTNVETTGKDADLPHNVFAASTASVDKVVFIHPHDGISATENSTSVVYDEGSGSRRTYCVKEEPESKEGKETSKLSGTEGDHEGTGYRATGHANGEHFKILLRREICAPHAERGNPPPKGPNKADPVIAKTRRYCRLYRSNERSAKRIPHPLIGIHNTNLRAGNGNGYKDPHMYK